MQKYATSSFLTVSPFIMLAMSALSSILYVYEYKVKLGTLLFILLETCFLRPCEDGKWKRAALLGLFGIEKWMELVIT